MKKNSFRPLLLAMAAMLFSTMSFAQESQPKPIKKLKVFNETQQKAFAAPQSIFTEEFKLSTDNTFSAVSERTDELGFTHQKFQQFYKGIKVEFGQTTLHAKEGKVVSMSNSVFRLDELTITPGLSANAALNRATAHIGAEKYLWQQADDAAMIGYERPEGELVIFPVIDQITTEARLAYKFDIYASAPVYRADVYVDAQTGVVLFENKRIHHADTPATGVSLYNGTVSFTADSYTGGYRLRQAADGGGIRTFDMNNGTNYSGASDITSADTSFPSSTATGVQAHFGAEQTHKYFMGKHNRNSFNGAGAIINSYVSYSSNYVNAFWDGSRMTYGDGDGVNYGPLVSLDIVGHEITHGVTEYTANLIYSYQSGALNESFSDIFGESIEHYAQGTNDWLMGDAIGAGGSGGALRSMSNPNAFNDPDTYLGTYWWTSSGDNGGVHINSGVQNYWFYLLVNGGSGTNDVGDVFNVSAIGWDKAEAIAYRNLAVYLTQSSQFTDARAGAIQAAIDLYGAGSPEEIAVTNAWYAVNVGDAYGGTPPPPDCVTGDVFLSITLDNYPEETAWTLKDASGATIDSASYSTANPDGSTVTATWSGLAAGDYTFTITDSYGDGICCSYGAGSYTVSSSSGTMFSGGSFGSSASHTFCIEGGGGGADTEAPSTPTGLAASAITETTATLTWNASTDNVGVEGYEILQGGSSLGTTTSTSANITGMTAGTTYTFDVRAYDAAGNNSGTASVTFTTESAGGGGGGGPVVLHQGNFETGWDGWIDGGSDSYRYAGSRSYEGTYSIRLRDNTSSSTMTLGTFDVSGYSTLDIEFYFYAWSMENGEDFWVQFYDGSAWRTVAAYARGTNFNNNTFYTATVSIDNASYNFPTNAQFRFRNDASANADHIYIDQVTITADAGTTLMGDRITALGGINGFADDEGLDIDGDFLMYPNPVGSTLNVRLLDPTGQETYRIVNILGQVVAQGTLMQTIDVSRLQSGVYILEINEGEEIVTDRFIKE